MAKTTLTVEETRAMFQHVARSLVEAKDTLTQADKAIGDGDHGVGMARGFGAVDRLLAGQTLESVDLLLKRIGDTLLSEVGGAAGVVFATLFRGGAKSLTGQTVFDSTSLARFLTDGLQAVKDRGKCKPGDKTMIDALEPASLKAVELASSPLNESLPVICEAADQGMERTKEMVARVGKAKTLGERSLGHADPGAISVSLILRGMSEYVNQAG